MRNTSNKLKTLYAASIAVAIAITAVYEANVLAAGDKAGDDVLEYYCTTMMELLTIILIPLALRLFKFDKVRNKLIKGGEETLLKMAPLRMALFALPMIVNTTLYYLFMSTTFGYMSIICLICMAFIYPSENRCKSEIADE